MKTHATDEHCPVCHGRLALTTEWGWIDDYTCTAVLCCSDCRTVTGMQDDAVQMHNRRHQDGESEEDTEQAALALIDPLDWHRMMNGA